RREADRGVVRMILDVGESGCNVVITRGCDAAFLKTIPIGGARLCEAVMKALDLDEGSARQLRIDRMSRPVGAEGATDGRIDRAVFEAVRPLLHELAQEAALCLRYYSVTFRGARPEAALLAGGNGAEPKLAEVLGQTLKLPVSLARSFDGIDTSQVD